MRKSSGGTRTARKIDPQVAHFRAKVAVYKRDGREAELRQAQAALRAARIEQEVREAVESDHPLTVEERRRIAGILLGGIDG